MSSSEGLRSTALRNMVRDHLSMNGDHLRKSQLKLLPGPSSHAIASSSSRQNKARINSQRFAPTLKDHVKGRLSLGTKILQLGGLEKVFKRTFSINKGEKFLKAFHCCLFTTAGPIPGLLFISSEKLAFCSDKPVIKFTSPTGELLRYRYKVSIPLTKIAKAYQTKNANKTSQRYLQVVTMDEFEFWFMGFFNFSKMFSCLWKAVSQA